MAMNPGADLPGDGTGPGTTEDERLECGRVLAEVWDASGSGTADPHTATCPYCGEALAQLALLGEAVRAASSEEDTARGADSADGADGDGGWDAAALTARVMDVVRLELRPGRPLPLGGPEEDLWVLEATAAKRLRAAGETVPGVRAGSCRVEPSGRGPVRVRLEVVAPFTPDLRELADEVRRRVWEAADEVLGLPVEAVDVTITDIADASGDAGADAGDVLGVRGEWS